MKAGRGDMEIGQAGDVANSNAAVSTRYNKRHVYFCKKRCNFGTDDIFFPAIVSVAVRATWFMFVLATCIYLYVHPSCRGVPIPIIFSVSIIGFVALQGVIALVEVALVVVSSLGTISNSRPRERINWVMYLRLAIFAFEIGWEIFSTYVVVDSRIRDEIKCSSYQTAETIYTVFVFVNWGALGVLVALFCIFLDPLGLCCVSSTVHLHEDDARKRTDPNDTSAPGVHRSNLSAGEYAQSVKTAYCSCLRKKGVLHLNKRAALSDAAKALGVLLGNFDATFTDKVSAFLLAAYFQKGLRNNGFDPGDELRRATVTLLQKCGNVNVDYNTPRPVEIFEKTQELENVRYYLQFAMAAYGWPIQVVLKPCKGPLSLCMAAKGCCCCACLQLHQFPGDDCFPNTAAITEIADVPEGNILEASFLNQVFETPFYVVSNPECEEVVIAIRGTLSLNDVLTDVAVSMEEVPEGLLGINHCWVHSGFLASAEELYVKLVGDVADDALTGSLPFQRLIKQKKYKIVITGHSLGAGVAAVLAVLFKDRQPEWSEGLVAYTYSTPGAVMSYDLAIKCKDFVISVVMGHEIVPRMTMRSLAYLKMMLERLLDLERLQLKKSELCCCVFCKWWTPDLPIDENFCKLLENQDPNDPLGSMQSMAKFNSFMPFTVRGRRKYTYHREKKQCLKTFLQRLDNLQGGARVATEQQPMMFLPGRILHIVETKEFYSRKCCGLQQVNKIRAYWKPQEVFSTILVHSDMLLDHTPSRAVSLMKMFDEQIPLAEREFSESQDYHPPSTRPRSTVKEEHEFTTTGAADTLPPEPLDIVDEGQGKPEIHTTEFHK